MTNPQKIIFVICLCFFNFLIVPFYNRQANEKLTIFYELEGVFEVEYFIDEFHHDVICLEGNKKYRFQSKEDHRLSSIVEKGDTLIKLKRMPYFELVKSSGEKFRFTYIVPK